METKDTVGRRDFLKVVGLAGVAAGTGAATAGPAAAQTAAAPAAHNHAAMAAPGGVANSSLVFFNPDEADFIRAYVDTLIPPSADGPSATEAAVDVYIDRAMASGYGKGARLYLQGPFAEGTPQQGYQLPLTPSELVKAGIADLNAMTLKTRGKFFKDLSADDRAAVLRDIEAGKATFATVPPGTWFGEMYQLVQEGYFGDPLYGGNKDKAVWKMIGYPGVPVMYADLIDQYRNKRYDAEPKSIADHA